MSTSSRDSVSFRKIYTETTRPIKDIILRKPSKVVKLDLRSDTSKKIKEPPRQKPTYRVPASLNSATQKSETITTVPVKKSESTSSIEAGGELTKNLSKSVNLLIRL